MEWNIQARAHSCQTCHRHFTDKESFHTLLYDEKHSYQRVDVCEACWAAQFSDGGTERKGFISHWVTMYSVPPAAAPEPIEKETADSLLRKLVEQNDPSHAGARFILAVMLERKRLLKVKAQVKEENRRIFIYEHAATGDLFQIPDPDLHLDQLEEVQRDVADLLKNGLDPKSDGSRAGLTESSTSPDIQTGSAATSTASMGSDPAPATEQGEATGGSMATITK